MRVMFSRSDDGRACSWRAEPDGPRRPFQGTTMAAGAGLPHDLAQFVVEDALGLEHGFWNLVANGATFKSIGRRRTRQGRQLIAAHRERIDEAERLANAHVTRWHKGLATPVGPALDAMLERWRALGAGEELVVDWQTRRLPGRGNGAGERRGRHARPAGGARRGRDQAV